MGRPSNADGQKTRQAILDAALDLFAEKGYFGTSLRDIATAVGVRESALYNYFPGKDGLFDELIVTNREQALERFDELAEQPVRDVQVYLERLVAMALDRFCEPRQRRLFRVLLTDGLRVAKEGRINLLERLNSGHARLRALMQRLMREGWLERADPDLLVMEFVGPLMLWRHMIAIRSEVPSTGARRTFAIGHVRRFLNGAAARGQRARPGPRAHGARLTPRRKDHEPGARL
jgi:AcrR family transcriptional regulator